MDLEEFMEDLEKKSQDRIKRLQQFAKRVWNRNDLEPIDVRNRCLDAWDEMKHDAGSKILPLVRISEGQKPTNLIFGSGSFSTGDFQVEQYETIARLVDDPPMKVQGIVANKSTDHGC